MINGAKMKIVRRNCFIHIIPVSFVEFSCCLNQVFFNGTFLKNVALFFKNTVGTIFRKRISSCLARKVLMLARFRKLYHSWKV